MKVGSWCPGSINPEDKGGFRGTRFYFKTIATMADLNEWQVKYPRFTVIL